MERLTDQEMREMYYFPKIKKKVVDDLENNAIQSIKTVCNNYNHVCFGYSGGKDSIVVQSLLDKAEIHYMAVIWQTIFQFPKNQEWIRKNAPEGLVFLLVNRPSIDDLKKDNDLLFCGTKRADVAYMKYKWYAQKKYLAKNGFDLFITGRRIAESNNCGKKSYNFIRHGNKYDSYSPIAEWSTEEVFAYIRYNDLELPWQYVNTANGFANGSVAWTERIRFGRLQATMEERLEEVFVADKSVLQELRNDIPCINSFLIEKGV